MPSKSFFDEDTLSERIELIKKLINHRVTDLKRYSLERPDYVAKEIEERFYLSSLEAMSSVFRRTSGPILLTLDSGMIFGFGSIESEGSVSVWVERDENGTCSEEASILNDDKLYPIDASDTVYSEKIVQELLWKKISSAKILRNEDLYSIMGVDATVGLSLVFENGQEIIISHNISSNIDDFAIIFRHEIKTEIVERLQEFSL